VTYSYYPGLKLSVSGQIDGRIEGKVFWDYGNGFNSYDSIDLRFSSGKPEESGEKLGTVTVESIGMKNFRSHGYGVWLIVDKSDLKKKSFIIEGEHKWGQWLRYKKNHVGRQLKLYPDARIVFPGQDRLFAFNLFHTLFSGIAKVTSENGKVAYYDGYGANRYDETERYYFGQKSRGEITALIDRYRLKFQKFLLLPRQRIERILITWDRERSIKDIKPARHMIVKLKDEVASNPDPRLIIKRLIVNGRIIDWADNRMQVSVPSGQKGKLLETPEDLISFKGRIYSFEVVTNAGSDDVERLDISLDGKSIDLFRKNNLRKNEVVFLGKAPVFTGSINLKEIFLKDHRGQIYSFPAGQENDNDILLDKTELDKVVQKKLHAGLFAVQLLTAGVMTFLFYWLSRLEMFAQSSGNRFSILFVQKKRWFFWSVFFLGLAVNLLFLAAEWPGSMTPDSLYINREAKWLQFTNHHPYIYSVFALGLYNIFDAPLMVIIFQMICFHLLSGLFFYILYSEGLSLVFLIPALVLPFFSLPINLFNITFWKDIPYSTLVLFWAFFFSYLFYKWFYCRVRITIKVVDAILLAVLFFLLCTLRFNGLVYLPLIPCMFCFFFWNSPKSVVTFSTISTLLLVTYYLVLPDLILYHKPEQNNYAKNTLEAKAGKLDSILENSGNYYIEDYLAERTKIFTASMGTSPVASTWYTDTHFPPRAWLSVREMRSDMVYKPQNEYLAEILKKILRKTTRYNGIFSGRFLFWNSSFALLGLCFAFVLYKWLPVSAFYSGFFLYQAFFMFFVVWPRWRYLYFIYLGGVFLLPVIFFELSRRKWYKQEKSIARG
jgi:hypothetical protein